jgi:hypothetical protein
METTTDRAAEIRAELKRAHGWTSRQVSVRAEYFSLGSSIDVVVKDPTIPLPTVKAIAERAESIRHCEVTGEILGGGNRYVSVTYSHAALDAIATRYADAVQRAVDAVEMGSNMLQPVDGTPFLVGRPNEYRITLWEDSYRCESNTVKGIAEAIGSLMVARAGREGR